MAKTQEELDKEAREATIEANLSAYRAKLDQIKILKDKPSKTQKDIEDLVMLIASCLI